MLLREARRQAGLSQSELAERTGTTQSVVSAYESGARQPSLPTLARLVAGTGLKLELRLQEGGKPPEHRGSKLASRLQQHREEVRSIASRHGLANIRVFGSVAREDDTAESDIDLLVDVADGVGLVGLARCQHELEKLLQAPVDLVPAGDLKPGVSASVLAEALSL
jgi:predicted nucleotidyltransferase/DNA-binding XRE family transcriptional regulator